jgi:hypothetical protein
MVNTQKYAPNYEYTSSPEAGAPTLPFKDNSVRKASVAPWFEQYFVEDEGEEDAEGTAVEIGHGVLKREDEQVLTRENIEKLERGENVLVGLQ